MEESSVGNRRVVPRDAQSAAETCEHVVAEETQVMCHCQGCRNRPHGRGRLASLFYQRRLLNHRLILGRNRMYKIDKFAHAAKVVALCLPPVMMSLIGLAALSRKKGGAVVVAGKRPAPTRGATRRSGTG